MTDREMMLKNVQMKQFAALDAHLFLDTHPDNKNALAYFRKQQTAARQAVMEYEARYGPLTARGQSNNEYWDWVDGPWPWEMEM
jgi:spore coat protein JB